MAWLLVRDPPGQRCLGRPRPQLGEQLRNIARLCRQGGRTLRIEKVVAQQMPILLDMVRAARRIDDDIVRMGCFKRLDVTPCQFPCKRELAAVLMQGAAAFLPMRQDDLTAVDA